MGAHIRLGASGRSKLQGEKFSTTRRYWHEEGDLSLSGGGHDVVVSRSRYAMRLPSPRTPPIPIYIERQRPSSRA